ncbi:MAG: hypothetical protein AMS22_15435 [Thiotrichales bacterium SG8_50]|jgi:hypothetical protein|nr:MAG: hypothetical protein AMS22_15435 [Thiotrichales bacterium SG8_50]
MDLTHHAVERMQQRGIARAELDCLLRYGRPEYDHHGGRIFFVDKSSRRRLAAHFGSRLAERVGRLYAVVGHDGAVLTVGHRFHRIKRH